MASSPPGSVRQMGKGPSLSLRMATEVRIQGTEVGDVVIAPQQAFGWIFTQGSVARVPTLRSPCPGPEVVRGLAEPLR